MIHLILVILIFTLVTTNLLLYLRLGRKRNLSIHEDLVKVKSQIEMVLSTAREHEKASISRSKSLHSTLSTSKNQIECSINSNTQNSIGRIGCLEDRVINEMHLFTNTILNETKQSHNWLTKSVQNGITEINTELRDIHQAIQDYKGEILKTQAQSFNWIESLLSTIRDSEHGFIEKEVRTIQNYNNNINILLKELYNITQTNCESLKSLESLFAKWDTLYNKLLVLNKEMLNQENSLSQMIDKHTQVAEFMQDLQKTSKDIFDLMKLVLLDSVITRTRP